VRIGHYYLKERWMPYLRITCPTVDADRRQDIASRLTTAVVELFTPPRGPSADDIRQRTTIHFFCYGADDLFIGGRRRCRAIQTSPWS